ncbi:MAG: hypothetical protein ABI599_15205 [Flavobacteriales bacterium]
MKRKGITIALLLLVVAVWGCVLFKVVRRPADNFEQVRQVRGTQWADAPVLEPLPDEALGNYRDPFLGDAAKPSTGVDAGARQHVAVVKSVTRGPNGYKWPSIAYHGSLRNNGKERSIALLSIDGREAMVPIGAEERGLRVKAIYTDSVLVAANGEVRVVVR